MPNMTNSTKRFDLLAALAEDCKLADHAYQLACATGDQIKMRDAAKFRRACMADYRAAQRAR